MLPVSEGLGSEPTEGLEGGRVGEALGPAHGRHQHGSADFSHTGEAAGQPVGIDQAVGGLSSLGVGVAFGHHRSQQTGLAGHLGSQVGEGHGRIFAVEVEGSPGHLKPGLGPLGAVVAPRGLVDEGADAGPPRSQHGPRIPVALEDSHVAAGQLPAHGLVEQRHGLAGQLPQADLVAGGRVGEAISSPHPSVEAGR